MVLSEGGVHRVGEELAEDDHHLVDRDQRAPDALGGGFAQEHRDGGTGTADGEAENDPEEIEDPDVRGEGAAERAEEEDHRQHGDVVPAPVPVGELAARGGADRGAHAQKGSDQTLLPGRQGEAARGTGQVHVGQGAGDDSGVVAEEQGAERGDQGDETQ